MTQNRVVLEILVDRYNEKGAAAFEHILTIFHKVLDRKPGFFADKKSVRPEFSLEIAYIGNKIRFFFVTKPEYKNFIINQIYAQYSNVEINEIDDFLSMIPDDKFIIGEMTQRKHYLYPIKNYANFGDSGGSGVIDPYSSITSALNRSGNNTISMMQVNFSPVWDSDWKGDADRIIKVLEANYPKFVKKILLSRNKTMKVRLMYPFIYLLRFIFKIFTAKPIPAPEEGGEENKEGAKEEGGEKNRSFVEKLSMPGYGVNVNLVYIGEDKIEGKMQVKELASTLSVYGISSQNSLELANVTTDSSLVKSRECSDKMILNVTEVAGLVHMPTSYVKTPSINWIQSRSFEPPANLPLIKEDNDITPLGVTNFRGTGYSYGIGPNDRRRHVYVVGKTGMGKSTILENMIIDDIKKGRGVAVIDPHGDLAESVIGNTPKSRTNDVIVFDPSDTDFPIAFNMLENVKPELRPLISSGLIGIFKKMFGDSWGPRLEHILRNTILALLEYPNTTLMSIPLMLTNDVFRSKVIGKIKDPIVKKFWTAEFERWEPKQQAEFSASILNKVGQFLSSSILRNVLGQPKNAFSIRWAMDNQKIVVVNLSKGKIGEDASSLLGSMLVTKFQIDAMSRADIPESQRRDFYLYVDEFQNFATDSFATILSEARKYKLNLVMANQYIDQMPESVRGAVFGNVGSLISFQVGYHDAAILKEVMGGDVTVEDLVNLRKYSIYSKLLIDGMPSSVFSSNTFPPEKSNSESFAIRYDKIQKVSREKYAKSKRFVEDKIYKTLSDLEKQEKANEKRKEEYKEKMKEEKRKKHEEMMKKQTEDKLKREQEEAKKLANMISQMGSNEKETASETEKA